MITTLVLSSILAIMKAYIQLFFFDLSFQTEKVTRDPKQLTFRYCLSANADQNFMCTLLYFMKKQLQ